MDLETYIPDCAAGCAMLFLVIGPDIEIVGYALTGGQIGDVVPDRDIMPGKCFHCKVIQQVGVGFKVYQATRDHDPGIAFQKNRMCKAFPFF